mmetsp:Transcript_33176/g.64155  ORF Transcript_33176/g.64155 Transcript_33176/m.64155 type:complete len:301 (-) Transcript_33176:480-1382(-)
MFQLLVLLSAATVHSQSVYEIASTTPGFELLTEAITEAELVDFFNDTDPITVFAPTNSSFEAYLFEKGANSISDLSGGDWLRVLLYHTVTNVAAYSSDLSDGQVITTASGNNITVLIEDDGTINIDDSTNRPAGVIMPNVTADNGVIHVINKVLVSDRNLLEVVRSTPELSALYAALVRAELVDVLTEQGPYTVFAPTNKAFDSALESLGAESLEDVPVDALREILLYHVVSGEELYSGDLFDGQIIETANTQNLTVGIESNGDVSIKDATGSKSIVVAADFEASNGVAHVIDRVLVPDL